MTGERTAIAAVLDAQGADEEVEPDLFELGLPETPSLRRLREEKRGRGRPLGARNKRTEATVQWLLSRFRDPRAVLLEIAQTPLDELQAALGCNAREALQEIRLAAIGVLPYVAKRMPIEVEGTGLRPVHLHINTGHQAPADQGLGSMAARLLNIIENQEVIDGEATEVEQPGVGQDG